MVFYTKYFLVNFRGITEIDLQILYFYVKIIYQDLEDYKLRNININEVDFLSWLPH